MFGVRLFQPSATDPKQDSLSDAPIPMSATMSGPVELEGSMYMGSEASSPLPQALAQRPQQTQTQAEVHPVEALQAQQVAEQIAEQHANNAPEVHISGEPGALQDDHSSRPPSIPHGHFPLQQDPQHNELQSSQHNDILHNQNGQNGHGQANANIQQLQQSPLLHPNHSPSPSPSIQVQHTPIHNPQPQYQQTAPAPLFSNHNNAHVQNLQAEPQIRPTLPAGSNSTQLSAQYQVPQAMSQLPSNPQMQQQHNQQQHNQQMHQMQYSAQGQLVHPSHIPVATNPHGHPVHTTGHLTQVPAQHTQIQQQQNLQQQFVQQNAQQHVQQIAHQQPPQQVQQLQQNPPQQQSQSQPSQQRPPQQVQQLQQTPPQQQLQSQPSQQQQFHQQTQQQLHHAQHQQQSGLQANPYKPSQLFKLKPSKQSKPSSAGSAPHRLSVSNQSIASVSSLSSNSTNTGNAATVSSGVVSPPTYTPVPTVVQPVPVQTQHVQPQQQSMSNAALAMNTITYSWYCTSCNVGLSTKTPYFECLICSSSDMHSKICSACWLKASGINSMAQGHDRTFYICNMDPHITDTTIPPQKWLVRRNQYGRVWYQSNSQPVKTYIKPMTAAIPNHSGWIEAKNQQGKVFYVSTITGETSWKRPATGMPKGWREVKTPEGKSFYVHDTLELATWTYPSHQPSAQLQTGQYQSEQAVQAAMTAHLSLQSHAGAAPQMVHTQPVAVGPIHAGGTVTIHNSGLKPPKAKNNMSKEQKSQLKVAGKQAGFAAATGALAGTMTAMGMDANLSKGLSQAAMGLGRAGIRVARKQSAQQQAQQIAQQIAAANDSDSSSSDNDGNNTDFTSPGSPPVAQQEQYFITTSGDQVQSQQTLGQQFQDIAIGGESDTVAIDASFAPDGGVIYDSASIGVVDPYASGQNMPIDPSGIVIDDSFTTFDTNNAPVGVVDPNFEPFGTGISADAYQAYALQAEVGQLNALTLIDGGDVVETDTGFI